MGRGNDRCCGHEALFRPAAHVRLIVWGRDCRHRVEPDADAMAERYGVEMSVPDWRERLRCLQCGRRNIDMVVSGARR
jgi:hypothetical protein